MDERTDTDLIKAAARGDEQAFTLLYYRYRDWVVALAWRFSRDEEIAMDVLQETFLRIHDGIDSLRDDERLTAWVFRIARNSIADHFRYAIDLIGPNAAALQAPMAALRSQGKLKSDASTAIDVDPISLL